MIKETMLVSALVFGTVMSSACGKKDDAAGGASSSDRSPAGLGEQAGRIYLATFAAVTKTLEGKPEAAEARTLLEGILEPAQQQLVELGKQRETMDAAGKKAFDGKLAKAISSVKAAQFEQLTELNKHYNKTDRPVGKLIADVNTLTQYANFELLKKQEPAAAKKYGVE